MNRASIPAALRYRLGRLGGAGVLGIGLMVFAAVLWSFGVRETARTLEQGRAAIAKLRTASAPHEPQAGGDLDARLREFRARFPPAAAIPAVVAQVHAAAQRRGVVVAGVEYREGHDVEGRLVRYEMALPVLSSYPQLRAWLGDVMNGQAGAVLEELSIRRDSIASPTVEARVRFAFHFAEP